MFIMDANEVYFYVVLYLLCTLEGGVHCDIFSGVVKHVTSCRRGGGGQKVHKNHNVITEWPYIDYLRQRSCGGTVILGVCLSLCHCLLAGYLRKLLTNLNQIIWKDRSLAKNQSTIILGLIQIGIQDEFFYFYITER